MKKNIVQVVLLVLMIGAAYLLYASLNAPIQFNKAVDSRQAAIIERLTDIRTIQRAYKIKKGNYTDDFSDLIKFIQTDSMEYEVAMGSMDDSVAVAEGRVSSKIVKMAARDTLFSGRKVDFSQLPFIPTTDGLKFKMDTITVRTESGVTIGIFEASTVYDDYLSDLDHQSLVNLKDKRDTENKFAGLKVGSLIKANNDAGSWEE